MSVTGQTRLESYRAILPHIEPKQEQIYNLLLDATRNSYSMTDKEIARALHRPINCVTNRRGELVDLGLVVAAGIKWDGETRRRVTAWKVKR